MLLGTLLTRLQSPDYAGTLLEGLDDLALLARIIHTAERFDESPADYAVNAIARFSQGADDEAWLAVMTLLERAPDPASACLRHMSMWALDKDTRLPMTHEGCTCGGEGIVRTGAVRKQKGPARQGNRVKKGGDNRLKC